MLMPRCEMVSPTQKFAGSQCNDEPDGAGGSHTPVWPPADAILVQLEEWLDSLRRLPADEGILARQDLLCQRIRELRMPLPAPPADPLTLVLRAKRATDKRRKQLHRFVAMRDDLLAQEAALQSAIVDAHTAIAVTQCFLNLAEDEEVLSFRNHVASLDAPGRVASPGAAEDASAAAARQIGHDPAVAAGVSGIITQLLMLPTAAEAPNLGDAYAALLEQARLVHEGFTGDKGPSLAPDLPSPGHASGSGGGVAPRMAWVPGRASPDPPGMPMPPVGATPPAAAAPLRTAGPPFAHGGYAGVGAGGSAPTPAESAGYIARALSASKSLDKSRHSAASSAAGSRAEERESSPRGQSAIAAALAAEVADVEAEAERHASTDDYTPAAGADSPEGDAGLPSATHSSRSAHSAAFGPLGSMDELRMQVAATAAILRMAADAGPGAGLDAARADAADAEAALAAALAAARAHPGDHAVRPMPQSLIGPSTRRLHRRPRPGTPAPRSLHMVPLPLGPGLRRTLPRRLGPLPATLSPLAALLRALRMPPPSLWWGPGVVLPPTGLPWAARVAPWARSMLAGASSSRHSPARRGECPRRARFCRPGLLRG